MDCFVVVGVFVEYGINRSWQSSIGVFVDYCIGSFGKQKQRTLGVKQVLSTRLDLWTDFVVGYLWCPNSRLWFAYLGICCWYFR
jgi:hypothetical protein